MIKKIKDLVFRLDVIGILVSSIYTPTINNSFVAWSSVHGLLSSRSAICIRSPSKTI